MARGNGGMRCSVEGDPVSGGRILVCPGRCGSQTDERERPCDTAAEHGAGIPRLVKVAESTPPARGDSV